MILVRELERAVRGYERLGFTVTRGGEHADGLTRNALVSFADGSYLELVAFLDPRDPRDNVWGWRPFLSSGGGLIDYCAASDDLGADTRGLEADGFVVDGPTEGGRRLPDGTEIRWRMARVRQEGRLLPFLIEDLTPRSLRVPGGSAAEHQNGATGVSRLELRVHDARAAARSVGALVGRPVLPDEPLRLGPCTLVPRASERLDAGEAGPQAIWLATSIAGGGGELDEGLTGGAIIRLLPGV